MIGFVAPDITDTDTWAACADEDLLSGLIDAEEIALALLLKAFRWLSNELDNILEGGDPQISLPLIGKHLDGGAGVCTTVNDSDGPLDELIAFLDLDHTVGEIRTEIKRTGKSTVLDQVKAQVKADNCYCEVTNPQGSCCLGAVTRFVRETKQALDAEPLTPALAAHAQLLPSDATVCDGST